MAVVGGAFVSHFLGYGTLVVAFGIFFPFMAESLSWSRGLLASATILAREPPPWPDRCWVIGSTATAPSPSYFLVG